MDKAEIAARLRKILAPDSDFDIKDEDNATEVFSENSWQFFDLLILLKEIEKYLEK